MLPEKGNHYFEEVLHKGPRTKKAVLFGHGKLDKPIEEYNVDEYDYVIGCHEATHPKTNVIVSVDWDIRPETKGKWEADMLDQGKTVYYGYRDESALKNIPLRYLSHPNLVLIRETPKRLTRLIYRRSGFWAMWFAHEVLGCEKVDFFGITTGNTTDYYNDMQYQYSKMFLDDDFWNDGGVPYKKLELEPEEFLIATDSQQNAVFSIPEKKLAKKSDFVDAVGISPEIMHKRAIIFGHGPQADLELDVGEYDLIIGCHDGTERTHPETNLVISCDWDNNYKKFGRERCQEEKSLDAGFVVIYIGLNALMFDKISDAYKTHPNLKLWKGGVQHPDHHMCIQKTGLAAIWFCKYVLRCTQVDISGITLNLDFYNNDKEIHNYVTYLVNEFSNTTIKNKNGRYWTATQANFGHVHC